MAADAAPGRGVEGAWPHRALHDRPVVRCPRWPAWCCWGHGAVGGPARGSRTLKRAPTPGTTRRPAHGAGGGASPPRGDRPLADGDGTPATHVRVGTNAGQRTPPATLLPGQRPPPRPHPHAEAGTAPASASGTTGQHGWPHACLLGACLPSDLRRVGHAARGRGPSDLVGFFPGPREATTLRPATQRQASGAADSRSEARAEAISGRLQALVGVLGTDAGARPFPVHRPVGRGRRRLTRRPLQGTPHVAPPCPGRPPAACDAPRPAERCGDPARTASPTTTPCPRRPLPRPPGHADPSPAQDGAPPGPPRARAPGAGDTTPTPVGAWAPARARA